MKKTFALLSSRRQLHIQSNRMTKKKQEKKWERDKKKQYVRRPCRLFHESFCLRVHILTSANNPTSRAKPEREWQTQVSKWVSFLASKSPTSERPSTRDRTFFFPLARSFFSWFFPPFFFLYFLFCVCLIGPLFFFFLSLSQVHFLCAFSIFIYSCFYESYR